MLSKVAAGDGRHPPCDPKESSSLAFHFAEGQCIHMEKVKLKETAVVGVRAPEKEATEKKIRYSSKHQLLWE